MLYIDADVTPYIDADATAYIADRMQTWHFSG